MMMKKKKFVVIWWLLVTCEIRENIEENKFRKGERILVIKDKMNVKVTLDAHDAFNDEVRGYMGYFKKSFLYYFLFENFLINITTGKYLVWEKNKESCQKYDGFGVACFFYAKPHDDV